MTRKRARVNASQLVKAQEQLAWVRAWVRELEGIECNEEYLQAQRDLNAVQTLIRDLQAERGWTR